MLELTNELLPLAYEYVWGEIIGNVYLLSVVDNSTINYVLSSVNISKIYWLLQPQ